MTTCVEATTSRSVDWWAVHQLVAPLLGSIGTWPVAGSIAWRQLDDDDPRKWAALLDAARHWALRIETAQAASAQASQNVSAATDWSAIARSHQSRRNSPAYIPRKRAS
jgi:hypothetical protein